MSHIRESLESASKVETIAKELSDSEFSVTSLRDINDIAVVSEIGSLYEELNELLAAEKKLIEPNIDLKKIKSIEGLCYKDNLRGMIKEVGACKEYVDTIIEFNDDVEDRKSVV